MAFLNILVLGCTAAIIGQVGAQFSCSQSEITEALVEDCVNAIRTDPGAWAGSFRCGNSLRQSEPFWNDELLWQAANRHSSDMATNYFFSHRGSDFSDVGGRAVDSGFGGFVVGENLGFGYSSAYDLVDAWLCSPGHRRNLVSCEFDSMGTSIECNSETCYVSQVYGCASGACCLNKGSSVLGSFFGSGGGVEDASSSCNGGFFSCFVGSLFG